MGDLGLISIPGLRRSPRGGHGNPLQYSCLENPHGQISLAYMRSQRARHNRATKHSMWKKWCVTSGKISFFLYSPYWFSSLHEAKKPVTVWISNQPRTLENNFPCEWCHTQTIYRGIVFTDTQRCSILKAWIILSVFCLSLSLSFRSHLNSYTGFYNITRL